MWIFWKKGFYSITVSKYDKEELVVRGRCEKDIKRFIEASGAGTELLKTPDRDYAFRTVAKKEIVSKWMVDAITDIDYTNFKNTAHGVDPQDYERSAAYMKCWSALFGWQDNNLYNERKAVFKKQKNV